jgi:hypothetical protein
MSSGEIVRESSVVQSGDVAVWCDSGEQRCTFAADPALISLPATQTLAVVGSTSIYLWLVHRDGHRLHLDAESAFTSPKLIPMSEVEKHNTRDSLWVVINGKVYDLTEVNLPPHLERILY